MSKTREWILQWVRDAHAMEEQAKTMLSGQASRLENYPELRARVEQHLRETQAQESRLRGYLKGLDTSESTFKDIGGKLMAMGQSFAGMFASDEVMKGSLASYTFEHMEIASYTMLIEAATAIGDEQLASICRQNLQEEIAMADWLKEHLPATTRQFLARVENGQEAQH